MRNCEGGKAILFICLVNDLITKFELKVGEEKISYNTYAHDDDDDKRKRDENNFPFAYGCYGENS
ncbi:CLUMA_CG012935, isoform A [Clunio marinus]|uniref:CLUMA_CG012935, isoform A n=1 Tax=Clunio marinus TaxID=568069 RepID=A0A1J1IH85_9DIPT|nr:CLUMA_CG012935, isoform A [Clunio marinus]